MAGVGLRSILSVYHISKNFHFLQIFHFKVFIGRYRLPADIIPCIPAPNLFLYLNVKIVKNFTPLISCWLKQVKPGEQK